MNNNTAQLNHYREVGCIFEYLFKPILPDNQTKKIIYKDKEHSWFSFLNEISETREGCGLLYNIFHHSVQESV